MEWAQQERCRLVEVATDAECFIDNFVNSIPIIQKHDFIAKSQAESFRCMRDRLIEGEVLVVADFSENYAFVYQDSVQSVHYNNSQATIHPFACYAWQNGEIKPLNCVIISDYLDHNTAAIHAFQKYLILFLKSKCPKLRKVIYYSDGAGSQYKNRYNMVNLLLHNEDFGVPAEWHFFATAHGKGPSDGLGGTIKRLATRASLQGEIIQTPQELFNWAQNNCNLNVVFVQKMECVQERESLNDRFNRAASIPGIRSFHSAIPLSTTSVHMKIVSSAKSGSSFNLLSNKRKIHNNDLKRWSKKQKTVENRS